MQSTVATSTEPPAQSLFGELKALLRLGVPIALVQLGMAGLNFVDVAMLGHHDPASMPAMALGNNLAWGASMFCLGTITGMDPLLSQAVGANDHAAVPRLLGRGLLLVLLLALPASLLLLPAATWLAWTGQPPELIPAAARFARWQSLALLPLLLYGLLRIVLSAHARLWPQVVTIVLGNLANALLDWVLIYGKFGFPAMGVDGAAIATVLCRWLMLFGLLAFGWRDLGPHLRALGEPVVARAAFALAPLWRVLRLGAPSGLQFVLEMGVFAAVALCIGNLDAKVGTAGHGLAGHQVAMQLATLSFMLPLGLGIAASVRVGWAVGAGDQDAVRRAVRAALLASGTVMAGFMLLFLLLPGPLAGLLTSQPEHLAMAAVLIPIAGVFQIGDGLQVAAIGSLRGLGDLRSPVVANVVGFWLLGLPLGLWLANTWALGAAGLWWGLVGGLFVVAGGLLFVLRRRLRVDHHRLRVD
ncbi:MAG: MATE family efflux transporter [Planctomycetes bacterium]|nr:MATE family efflux transporter [Planctomycetota bacterium]